MNSLRVEKLYNAMGMSSWVTSVRQTKGARTGFTLLTLVFGGISYYNYNKRTSFGDKWSELEKKLHRDFAIDLNSLIWYNHTKGKYDNHLSRMSEEDYEKQYFMARCKVTGSFDHTKEILVPQRRNQERGYLVFTPFYYADFQLPLKDDQKTANTYDYTNLPDRYIQKDAVIVNRGW